MEYTERKGIYHIEGVLQIKQTPDGWTIFERNSKLLDTYAPIQGEHYDKIALALEKAEAIMSKKKLGRGK